MSTALLLLATIIAITPELIIVDGMATLGPMLGIVAIGIAVVAAKLQPGEAAHFRKLIGPFAIVGAIPAAWMLLQMCPLPVSWLAHPIWESAAATLERSMTGSITIDVGATALSFAEYLSVVGIVLLSSAISIDRHRAERVLFILTGATTLIAVVLIGQELGYLGMFSQLGHPAKRFAALDSAALGLILSASSTIRTYERLQTRNTEKSSRKLVAAVGPSVAAFAICLCAVLISHDRVVLFAAAYGIATLFVVATIRRLGLGWWGYSGIVIVAIVCASVFLTTIPNLRGTEPTLALATQGQVAITERMLPDVPWTGTGAGTFGALLPIYRDANDDATATNAPTASAEIAVEMGRPMLWVIVIIVGFCILLFLHCALHRGRDYFYASAGAGCLLEASILSSGNPGPLDPAIAIVIGVSLGLAIGQSKSWMVTAPLAQPLHQFPARGKPQ